MGDKALASYLASGGRVLEGAALGRLAGMPDPPARMFARAGFPIDGERAVAIVGSRAATEEGLARARRFAQELAKAGITVVSGGAVGIDCAAQMAAHAAGGRTIAVLGTPARARDERPPWLRRLTAARTLSLAPHAPGTPGSPKLFASRNRYIAALADQVIVIEGREGSGTRYTAIAAFRQKTPVWVWLDGTPATAIGYRLVEQGARVLAPWRGLADVIGRPPAPVELPFVRSHPLLAAIAAAGGRLLVDEAARRLAAPAQDVLADAAGLELDGLLRVEGAFLVNS